jgi:hypothetical protein
MSRLLFFLAATCFVCSTPSLKADQIVLDDVMTKEDRQKTGIEHLSLSQKVALEAWLNKNFILKPQGQTTEATLSLSINIDNGQKLQLSDNSIWEIAPNDVPTSAVWITPFPVKIMPSNDQQYPWLIVNVNSGVSVKARKISATP